MPAFGHALNFESDLNADGKIVYCNPKDISKSLVNAAANNTNGWDKYYVEFGGGVELLPKGQTNKACELKVTSDAPSTVYAQVNFATHPDKLQINKPNFSTLSAYNKQGVLSHEFGHTEGIDHNTLCSMSVMPTLISCQEQGVERPQFPSSHDRTDYFDYWVNTPIYPIPNKCPTSDCVTVANEEGGDVSGGTVEPPSQPIE
jgi:hypothetical protein